MEEKSVKPSEIYIVSTPIGHLGDLTLRAQAVLCQADVICAEDTRHSARLLEHIGSKVPMMALHEHNEFERSQHIIDRLARGESVALISDAGTPLISDPGYKLVRAIIEAGYKVVPVPGASAVIAALSVAGLPTDRFFFEGFLASKSTARTKQMASLANFPHTWVFYESSHRILASLEDLASVLGGERYIVVARELTKTFETLLRGKVAEVIAQVKADDNQQKGEFVVMVSGLAEEEREALPEQAIAMLKQLASLLPPKKAAQAVAAVYGGGKKVYYDWLLRNNDQ